MTDHEVDEALRALSHPARRTFVRACLIEAKAAGDLSTLSHLSLATVSEHLKVLRKSGLLILDRQGRFWMYRTDAKRLGEIALEIRRLGER